MKRTVDWIVFAPACCLVVLAGCARDASTARTDPSTARTAAASTAASDAAAPPSTPSPAAVARSTPPGTTIVAFPDARSVSIAVAAPQDVLVAFGRDEGLFVARSEDGGRTFGDAVRASGDRTVHVMPIERPAIATDGEGRVGVAWLEIPPDGNGAAVWYADSADGGRSFGPGRIVAADDEGETTMVSVAMGPSGDPLLAWLNGSSLRTVRSVDRGRSFGDARSIGDGSCECCQPAVVVDAGRVLIAYRGLERGGAEGDVRDLALIRSMDGGETFEPVTAVSDAHWRLRACPIAGPSLAVRADRVHVAWMDGRAAPPGTLSRGDVWLAASVDGGASFGPNVRVNADASAHHTLPTIDVAPGGRIHVAWQADAAGARVLYHTTTDDGRSFAPPDVIASSADADGGRPQMPTLAVGPLGRVALAWVDDEGAHVASWADGAASSPR